VKLDCGVTALTHLHSDVFAPGRVRVALRLDKSGNGVLVALPSEDNPNMNDDPLLRELTASVKFRRVLITDARTPVALPLAQRLAKAGASIIFAGAADSWRTWAEEKAFREIKQVQVAPLDLTNTVSVQQLAGDIGAKTDILINTADYVRPGGVLSRPTIVTSRDEFETNVFGLQRLAQAFGPVMRTRGADGVNSACAFVDIAPVHAICNWPEFGAYSATGAARLSLLQCIRAELGPGGVRVMSVITGPLDDAWRQAVPPPKVEPARLAQAIVDALERGVEDTIVGDVGNDIWRRWRDDPKVLERELQS
jgi:NAD(P)-dependent dehydrogenase (short-subunit alcohol dehydrogenase family)